MSDSLWPHELYSLPDSSVHGIFQTRILEWVAVSFSRGSSWPRSPAFQADSLPSEPPGDSMSYHEPHTQATSFFLISGLFIKSMLSRDVYPVSITAWTSVGFTSWTYFCYLCYQYLETCTKFPDQTSAVILNFGVTFLWCPCIFLAFLDIHLGVRVI